MATLNKILGALKKGVSRVKINDKLTVPVVESVNDVPETEEGTWVYVTGEGSRPEGFWRYTSAGFWEAGGTRPRHNSTITQRTLVNGETFVIHQFNLPADAQIVIWEVLLRNTQGNNNGLRLEVRDTTAGVTIYEYDASTQAPEIDFGNPLASGGAAGNEIRIRGRNSSGQNKEASGFLNWSFERV